MSSKKSKPVATVVPKAKFVNGQKVFICVYAFSGPGKILQGMVSRSDTYKRSILSDNGKICGSEEIFSYIIHTDRGDFEQTEWGVYSTFPEAAKDFGRNFVEYLK